MNKPAQAWQNWFLAIRPKTLWASVAPVLLGSLCALNEGTFKLSLFMLILCCALLIQIASNLANDVYDFEKGADHAARLGPTRVAQAGLISPQQIKLALFVVMLTALLLGAYLVMIGGLPILLIGMLSLVFALAYTAGPYPLAYLGLGEIFVLIFFGPVAVGGTYYLFSAKINSLVLGVGLSAGMISSAILVVNNLRDIESDRLCGKLTLAARFGAEFARLEYIALLVTAALIPVALCIIYSWSAWVLLSSLFIVAAWPLIRTIRSKAEGPPLNDVLAGTAQLLLVFSGLFAISCLP